MTDPSAQIGNRRSVRFVFTLLAIAFAGVLSLLAMPLEAALPEGVEVPRAVLLIQPTVLVAFFTFAGWLAAWKTGLEAAIIAHILAHVLAWSAALLSS